MGYSPEPHVTDAYGSELFVETRQSGTSVCIDQFKPGYKRLCLLPNDEALKLMHALREALRFNGVDVSEFQP